MAVLGSDVVEQGDHLLFRAGQPMRVESGTLDVSYVSFRNQHREALYSTQAYSIVPSARSVEFGVGYGIDLGGSRGGGHSGGNHIRFALDYVMKPGHRRTRDEVFGIMSFRREF